MDIKECISIVENQEKILRFSSFNRRDVWELGQQMVSGILKDNMKLSLSIRLLHGFNLFQYAPEGITIDNESWMTRKFNVVRDFEISSLLNFLRYRDRNQTLQDRGYDPQRYALSGGSFPIHISGTGIIGAVVASGMPHLIDHGFIVDNISRFLNIKDVPVIPVDTKI